MNRKGEIELKEKSMWSRARTSVPQASMLIKHAQQCGWSSNLWLTKLQCKMFHQTEINESEAPFILHVPTEELVSGNSTSRFLSDIPTEDQTQLLRSHPLSRIDLTAHVVLAKTITSIGWRRASDSELLSASLLTSMETSRDVT